LHDLTLATQYADRLVVIDGGRLVTEGQSREVIRSSALAAPFGIALRVLDVDGVDVVVPVRH
jgi:iron complex transport system ATP-binding protein